MIEKVYEDRFGTVHYTGLAKDLEILKADSKYLYDKTNGSKFYNIENLSNSLIWDEENKKWLNYNGGRDNNDIPQEVINKISNIENDINILKNDATSIQKDVNNLNSQIAEVATTGTTMEAVQTKVQEMAEAGQIQAYTIADKSIDGSAKIADETVTLDKLNPDIFGVSYTVNNTGAWASFPISVVDNFDISNGLVFSFLCDTELKSPVKISIGYGTSYSSDNIDFTKSIDEETGLYKYVCECTTLKATVKTISIIVNGTVGSLSISGTYSNIELYSNNIKVGIKVLERDYVTINRETNFKVASKKYVKEEIGNFNLKDETVGINNLTDEAKLLLIGGEEKEIEITSSLTNFSTYYEKPLILSEKLPPCIIKNIFQEKCKVIIFDSLGTNAEIQKIEFFENASNINFVLEKGGYLGVVPLKADGTINKFNVGKRNDDKIATAFHTFDYNTYSSAEIGEKIITVSAGAKYTNLKVIIEPLVILSMQNNIEENKNLINKVKKDLSNRIISKNNPIRNTAPYSQYKDITLQNGEKFEQNLYQVFDEWKYKVIFSVNTINSKFKIYSIDGEWENGYIILDFASNKLDIYSNLPSNPNILISSNEIPFTLEMNKKYVLQITRDGLIMTISITDKISGEIFTCIGGKRLHGGIGVTFSSEENDSAIIIDKLEWRLPLFNSAKALFVGDSITEGLSMGTNDINKRWASLLRNNYFEGNAIVCGRGFGTSANVLDILEKIMKYGYNFDYIFVMIGGNETKEESINGWKTNMVNIYNKILGYGSMPIIICPPCKKVGQEYIIQMKNFVLENEWDTIRMDLATSIDGLGIEQDSTLSTDGTHFNEIGNEKMYERAIEDLNIIL